MSEAIRFPDAQGYQGGPCWLLDLAVERSWTMTPEVRASRTYEYDGVSLLRRVRPDHPPGDWFGAYSPDLVRLNFSRGAWTFIAPAPHPSLKVEDGL